MQISLQKDVNRVNDYYLLARNKKMSPMIKDQEIIKIRYIIKRSVKINGLPGGHA
jgi:hypothetical protein